jgi:hypothetical protein
MQSRLKAFLICEAESFGKVLCSLSFNVSGAIAELGVASLLKQTLCCIGQGQWC